MRTTKEIEDLRRDAKSMIDASRQRGRLASLAERKARTLQAALEALAHYRAAERGVSVDDLSDEDVFATDDERALNRLFMLWNMEAGTKGDIAENESFDRVVARLALDRGWNMMDATRALLKSIGDEHAELRDSAPRAVVRRVRDAMDEALAAQLSRIESHLLVLENGRPSEKAGIFLYGALLSLVSGREIDPDSIRSALIREKERLTAALSRRRKPRRSKKE